MPLVLGDGFGSHTTEHSSTRRPWLHDQEKALIVIPTYNEIANLECVTRDALDTVACMDILVVDDGSPDGTGRLADEISLASSRVHVLHRPSKLGLGSAYRTGFAWGLERGYDVLGEMDADGSHQPADLPALFSALSDADLVIGSRYVPSGSVIDWPWQRKLLSRAGNCYTRALTGLPVRDATSGFRLLRRSVAEALPWEDIEVDGYAFQVETALHAWRHGFRIKEVPITFIERRHGVSKIDRRIILEATWRVAAWRLRNSTGRKSAIPLLTHGPRGSG